MENYRDNKTNAKQIEILRRLRPYERLKAAFQLHEFARRRVAAELRRDNPNLSDGELLIEINRRFMR